MTEHRDLDVLLVWCRTHSNQAEQLSNEQEGYRTAHADDPGTFAASLVRAVFLRLHPTAEPQEVKEPADEQERDRAAHADDLGRRAEPLLRRWILSVHPSGGPGSLPEGRTALHHSVLATGWRVLCCQAPVG
jgi:hypothetical protein